MAEKQMKNVSGLSKYSDETIQSGETRIGIAIGVKRERNQSFGKMSNDATQTKDEFTNVNQSATLSETTMKKNARERDKDRIQGGLPIPKSR